MCRPTRQCGSVSRAVWRMPVLGESPRASVKYDMPGKRFINMKNMNYLFIQYGYSRILWRVTYFFNRYVYWTSYGFDVFAFSRYRISYFQYCTRLRRANSVFSSASENFNCIQALLFDYLRTKIILNLLGPTQNEKFAIPVS